MPLVSVLPVMVVMVVVRMIVGKGPVEMSVPVGVAPPERIGIGGGGLWRSGGARRLVGRLVVDVEAQKSARPFFVGVGRNVGVILGGGVSLHADEDARGGVLRGRCEEEPGEIVRVADGEHSVELVVELFVGWEDRKSTR